MPRWAIALATVIGVGFSTAPTGAQAPFTEEAAARGLSFFVYGGFNGWGRSPGLNDLDGDGDLDIVMVGSITNFVDLYENIGGGNFVGRGSGGLPTRTVSNGVTAADYDGDGDLDLYITEYQGNNVLARNDGDFSFTDATLEAGLADPAHTVGCAWGDYDSDGWIDILIVNHSPGLDENNRLLRNLGNGEFEDVTNLLGLEELGPSFQALFIDYDRDGDVDLYVVNDKGPNLGFECRMWRNDDGTLTDVSFASGSGIFEYAMGLGAGDVNRDGYLDLYVTNTATGGGNVLLMNQADGTFIDEALTYGVEPVMVGWGAEFFDFDNDGFEDLYMLDATSSNKFYRGGPTTPFAEIGAALGVDSTETSYSASPGDIDLDGDLDMLVSSNNWPLELYINNEGSTRNWIDISLSSATPNTRAIGAIVDITSGGVGQTQAVYGTGSFKNSIPYSLHFGLDDQTVVDSVTVHWPGGAVSEHGPFDSNQRITLDDSTAVVPEPQFIRADANADGSFDIADPVLTLSHLFQAEQLGCQRAADANADDVLDISDTVFALSALFGIGPPVSAPHPECGDDPSASLTCNSTPNCP